MPVAALTGRDSVLVKLVAHSIGPTKHGRGGALGAGRRLPLVASDC